MNTQIHAHAKINLHLSVLNRREDGFHNIFSIMAGIGLYDLLKLEAVEINKSQINVTLLNKGGTESAVLDNLVPEKNLVYIAAMKYLEKSGIKANIVFSLQKNIPAGAGLGGGSSDAASALILLNRYFNRMSRDELISMGTAIGADVPFCLHGGYAFCSGIGDIIDPIKGTLPYHVVLANNGTHVNTAEAYKSLSRDKIYAQNDKKIDDLKTEVRKSFETKSLSNVLKILENDFESVVFNKHPELEEIKNCFYKNGAEFSMMTGSGSTIIALYKNEEKADRAYNNMKNKYKLLYKTSFTN